MARGAGDVERLCRGGTPLAALFTGLVAGIITPLLVELFELALSIDDPSGAISVHGVAGLWGLAAAGIFAPQEASLWRN